MEKFDFCAECRFKDHLGYTPGGSVAEDGCDLLVIMEYPQMLDCRQKQPAHNESRVLRSLMAEKSKGERVAWQFALGCLPYIKNGKGVCRSEDFKRCAKRLKEFIRTAKPRVVLALGKGSLPALGIKKPLPSVRGRIFDIVVEEHPMKVVVSNGIDAVNLKPGLYGLLERDIEKALQLCRGGFEKPDMRLDIPEGYKDVIASLRRARDEIEAGASKTGKKVILVFDLETTSLDHYRDGERVIAVSLSWERNQALAFMLDHREALYTGPERADILRELEGLLTLGEVMTCAANSKFDYNWLRHGYGMDIKYPDFDVVLLEHILEEDKKGNYGLKKLVVDYCPPFAGYEDNLMDELEGVKNRFRTAYREARIKKIEEYREQWLDYSDQEREDLLIAWVRKGYLPATVIEKYSRPKTVRFAGKRVVSKGHLKALAGMLEEIPPAELGIELPAEQEATFEDIPVKTMLEYAALDAFLTRVVFIGQYSRITEEYKRDKCQRKDGEAENLLDVYQKYTLPMSLPVAEMEYNGIRVDREKAKDSLLRFDDLLSNYERMLHEEAGHNFNINSHAALQAVVFNELGYKPIKKTPKGTYSLDEKTLLAMYDDRDTSFLKTLLSYRKVKKVRDTYVKKWVDLSGYDGRLRYSLHQNGTATYRLSSSDPGMQNVPAFLEEEQFNLKALFLPDSEDFDLYDLDISNAEMRVLCAYSEDDTLIEAFNSGLDIHCLTGANISDYSYEDLKAHKGDKTSDQYKVRQLSKEVNFGVIFMMGAKGLSKALWSKQRIKVSEAEAQEYLDRFFKKYPGVRVYISYTQYLVKNYGFAWTYTGRKRRFPVLRHSYYGTQGAFRQAVNFRIQSTAADIVNANLVDLNRRIKPLGGRVLLTVHDSILFQLPKDTPGVRALLDEVILDGTKERFPWLPVPWKYDVGKGPNYGECDIEV